ncbi:protein phosphatase 2a [Colletotrichum karsti]|uniref:Serine/threonine-protein phosphatase n=1 Tax=Colletotrichum karsti TaxID=1095194 RepID=A0A9P6LML1_9PEZI|nr:protein phosphatase 2a [Colletotrichum karsti]KAF9877607.1 protein phosphatase 2a [Colletotrichum karsti]
MATMSKDTESAENKESQKDDFPEAFPDFDENNITQIAPQTTTEGNRVQRDATESDYRPPTEAQIQAAIQRANLAFSNPLTNVPRRGPPGAGRARNRSTEVSFSLPTPNPGIRSQQSPRLPQAPTTSSPPPVASGSTRGRGISVPGRAGYIPTLPAANRTAQLIRPRATNFSRPIVVGGFDNPYQEHLQRLARREADDKRALEAYSKSPTSVAQQPRPLPELPPATTIPPPVFAHAEAPPPAQPANPPHPLRSNPVASSPQEPSTTLPRRRQRSSSISIHVNDTPAIFCGTFGNRPVPETIPEETSNEEDDFDYSEEPVVHTAQVGRVVRRPDDLTNEDDSSNLRLRGGTLDIEDFDEGFDPDYYESDECEDDLVELTEEFNPNISEDFDPYEAEANSQVHAQILDNKMASHIPRPGPAQLSPNAGLDEWLEEAKQCHYLPERAMKELCELVKEVLMEESNIQPVCTPVTICGDIHGQFYDLLELFRVAGGMPGESRVEAPKTATTVISPEDIEPPTEITNPKLKKKLKNAGSPTPDDEDDDEAAAADTTTTSRPDSAVEVSATSQSADTRFVFLGDFVDRGYFSLETFTLLMCLKAKYPDRIVLVRGNHESRQITQVYGFYEECQQKYGNASVWKACCHVFDFLVLAAIVDGELLCVHGGLSPEIRTIDQIRVVARAQEIPHEGAFCDLVWSDPEDVETWAISPRGAGWLFGDKVATEFNHVNGLKLIARAHQLVNEGYKYHFPQNSVVTVWSAPNYCYRCGNVASIMTVDKDMSPKFSIFSAVPDDQRHVPANRRGPGDYFL